MIFHPFAGADCHGFWHVGSDPGHKYACQVSGVLGLPVPKIGGFPLILIVTLIQQCYALSSLTCYTVKVLASGSFLLHHTVCCVVCIQLVDCVHVCVCGPGVCNECAARALCNHQSAVYSSSLCDVSALSACDVHCHLAENDLPSRSRPGHHSPVKLFSKFSSFSLCMHNNVETVICVVYFFTFSVLMLVIR